MKRKRILSAVLMCAVGVGICGLYCGLMPRRYTVSTPKLNAEERLRIVMLSDLHSYVYGNDQTPLLRRVKELQPDIIALCGDIVDDKQPQDGAKLLLKQITEIAPRYYVSGNHEYWSSEPEQIFRMIESYGIHVLHNERERITVDGREYVICGVDDPAAYGDRVPSSYGNAASYRKALQSFDDLFKDDAFHILLAHRPEYIEEYAAHPFDLTLCGHAHGGQWRIPYIMNGLIAPNQGFFPEYAGGQYQIGAMTEIVGRGLVLDWKPRVFNPPEIVVVDIAPQ